MLSYPLVVSYSLYFFEKKLACSMDARLKVFTIDGGNKELYRWIIQDNKKREKEFCFSSGLNTSVDLKYPSDQ